MDIQEEPSRSPYALTHLEDGNEHKKCLKEQKKNPQQANERTHKVFTCVTNETMRPSPMQTKIELTSTRDKVLYSDLLDMGLATTYFPLMHEIN